MAEGKIDLYLETSGTIPTSLLFFLRYMKKDTEKSGSTKYCHILS
jgi:hypothetical protein